MVFLQTLLATSAVAILSLVGILLVRRINQRMERFLLGLVALSAGAMLGNAMFHLFPEAIETGSEAGIPLFKTMIIVTFSFVLSFLFEQGFRWHHCHSGSHHGKNGATFHCDVDIKPVGHLVLLSDAIHNFVDGLIIGAAFLVSPILGVSTAAAVALHEVPQEIGDFAVLVYGGFRVKRALLLNLLSASTVIAGGVIGHMLSASVTNVIPLLLPFAAGSFLYIAASDLLPELKHEEDARDTALHFFIFLFGLVIMMGFALME